MRRVAESVTGFAGLTIELKVEDGVATVRGKRERYN